MVPFVVCNDTSIDDKYKIGCVGAQFLIVQLKKSTYLFLNLYEFSVRVKSVYLIFFNLQQKVSSMKLYALLITSIVCSGMTHTSQAYFWETAPKKRNVEILRFILKDIFLNSPDKNALALNIDDPMRHITFDLSNGKKVDILYSVVHNELTISHQMRTPTDDGIKTHLSKDQVFARTAEKLKDDCSCCKFNTEFTHNVNGGNEKDFKILKNCTSTIDIEKEKELILAIKAEAEEELKKKREQKK